MPIPQPLSTASTIPVSSIESQQQERHSITNTQLAQQVGQKVTLDVSSVRVSSVSMQHEPQSQSIGRDKMVQFKGLYVVRGPTDSKHVRYTMDITSTELQLRGRCIQRFQSFFRLRKSLLEVLKTCHGRLPSRKSTWTGVNQEPQLSAGAELVKILTRARSIQCPECELLYDELLAVAFPRRTWCPPSLQDAHERSQLLETFLDYCVRTATTRPACQRSNRLFTAALGKFLGMDIKAYLATDKDMDTMVDARTIVSVHIHDPEEQQTDSDKTGLTPCNGNEHFQSDDFKDDCHSEPNFSFISNPLEDDNDDARMVRSKSHA